MNRKVLAAAIALLMILSTILMAVPVNAITSPLPVFNNASGATCSQQTIRAPGAGVLVTGLTPAREVFVMFDKEVADADLGMPLFAFLANEMFVNTAPGFPVGPYIPGEPIYLHVAAGATVNIGDTRLTSVTAGANVYATGSVVAAGDTDIGPTFTLAPFPANTMHTDAATGYVIGNGIYIRDPANIVAGFNDHVGPGDVRALYPSVTVTLAGTGITAKYAAWTKVYSPVFDYQKAIYNDIGPGNAGSVGAGDVRERNVVIPQVRYPAGATAGVSCRSNSCQAGAARVLAGAQDVGLGLTAFGPTDYFADTNNNGIWDQGETIYVDVAPHTGLVKAVVGEIRNSYVGGYLPTTTVTTGDTDIGTPITAFPAKQKWYGPGAAYVYADWVYYNPAGLGAVVAAGDMRSSQVDWTDKGMGNTGLLAGLLPAAWTADWPNVVGYIAGSHVAAGDADVGRRLTAFDATDKHTGASPYVSGDLIYRDNDGDNIISVGDTRQVIVGRGPALVPYPGPWPWTAANAPYYIPGTNIAAGDADAILTPLQTFCTGVGTPVAGCAGAEMYYDQFNDGAYLGSDLVAVGGVSNTGYAAPFPVEFGLLAGVPIPFTVPNAPLGNHVVMITTDEPPTPALAGVNPFLNAGWQASAVILAGATLPFESLPWFVGPLNPTLEDWDTSVFAAQAGPAFFAVISKGCAVQMSPGAYAHTLGTPASIVKLDYPKGAIVENSTGDISLNIILCSEVSSIAIYLPPEFTLLQSDTTSVWTSITNDYSRISMDRLGSNDPIGPSWWSVRITSYTAPGSYTVRLFNVQAPEVCGRYFVKVFIDGESIGAENFPTIVVKGGLYPAYISGRVLNANIGQYGPPVGVSGKVVAEGKTALGEAIQAQAYFNASANGAYTIYGLAAGTYNLTASAAGFVPETLNRTVSVDAGQSLEGVDIYVYPSATISGTICSKCGVGAIPWGSAASHRISMELLDSNLQSIGFLATNATNVDPSQPYYPFSFNGAIELDGHVPQDRADYVSGLTVGDYYLQAYVNGYLQRDVVAVHVYEYSRIISVPFDLWRSSQFNVTVHFKDAGGSVSPTPQNGMLLLEAFGLDGGIEGYNTTSVPENSTSWTMMITGKNNGLPSGTYFIEASFPGYSQAFFPQATLGGGCSTTNLSFDMVRSGLLYVTLRSVNWQTPPLSVPWGYPCATIRIEAIGSQQVYSGTTWQGNAIVGNKILVGVTFANITDLPPDTYLIRAYTVGYVQTKDYQVSMSFGGMSDIQIDLVEATRLNVALTFRKEGLVAPIDTYARYNSKQVPVRIEVYDSSWSPGRGKCHSDTDRSARLVWPSVEVVGFQSYAGNPTVRWVNYYDATDGSMQNDYGLPPGTYTVFVWVPGICTSPDDDFHCYFECRERETWICTLTGWLTSTAPFADSTCMIT